MEERALGLAGSELERTGVGRRRLLVPAEPAQELGAGRVPEVISLEPAQTVHDFEAVSIDGRPVRFADERGKVMLIVNTASACGFTPQFAGLEELHKRYGERGLVVLGFPCNQFGNQDPGTNDEIASFCQMNYGVSFPMMQKVDVNGAEAHPLYRWLTAEAPGLLGSKSIKWNFTKFLVGKDGKVLKRYAPQDAPEKLAKDVEAALAA